MMILLAMLAAASPRPDPGVAVRRELPPATFSGPRAAAVSAAAPRPDGTFAVGLDPSLRAVGSGLAGASWRVVDLERPAGAASEDGWLAVASVRGAGGATPTRAILDANGDAVFVVAARLAPSAAPRCAPARVGRRGEPATPTKGLRGVAFEPERGQWPAIEAWSGPSARAVGSEALRVRVGPAGTNWADPHAGEDLSAAGWPLMARSASLEFAVTARSVSHLPAAASIVFDEDGDTACGGGSGIDFTVYAAPGPVRVRLDGLHVPTAGLPATVVHGGRQALQSTSEVDLPFARAGSRPGRASDSSHAVASFGYRLSVDARAPVECVIAPRPLAPTPGAHLVCAAPQREAGAPRFDDASFGPCPADLRFAAPRGASAWLWGVGWRIDADPRGELAERAAANGAVLPARFEVSCAPR